MKSKAAYYVTRFLLGAAMGGFIPDIVLWLTYYFVRVQLASFARLVLTLP